MASVALHGNLRDFGIAEVFQLIGQQRKTGTLRVGGEQGEIFLAFDAGGVVRGGPIEPGADLDPIGRQLVRAGYLTRDQIENLRRESERSARPISDLLIASGLIQPETLDDVRDLLTREAVFDVMRLETGDFHFTAEPVVHDSPPERLLAAEQILMDGLRMLDEWRTFADVVPSEGAVFRRVGDLAAVRALTMGESDARMGHMERVLQLIDGRLDVRRIIDLSRIGTFEATRALAELRQAGVIELVSAAPRRTRSAPVARRRRPLMPMLRAALATALSLAALAAVGGALIERSNATAGLPGSAIPERSWAALEARHEAQLVRTLVETHRFETGSYPESLQLVEADLASIEATLTRSELDDYYYVVRDDEVVLLAPMY